MTCNNTFDNNPLKSNTFIVCNHLFKIYISHNVSFNINVREGKHEHEYIVS